MPVINLNDFQRILETLSGHQLTNKDLNEVYFELPKGKNLFEQKLTTSFEDQDSDRSACMTLQLPNVENRTIRITDILICLYFGTDNVPEHKKVKVDKELIRSILKRMIYCPIVPNQDEGEYMYIDENHSDFMLWKFCFVTIMEFLKNCKIKISQNFIDKFNENSSPGKVKSDKGRLARLEKKLNDLEGKLDTIIQLLSD